MNELLVTIIFITALVLGVYWYAGYSIRSGIAVMKTKTLFQIHGKKTSTGFLKAEI